MNLPTPWTPFLAVAILLGTVLPLPGQQPNLGRLDPEAKVRLREKKISPYVPTPMSVVEKVLELAQVREHERVYDLGSGDGRIVITAAQKYGARGVGIELDPRLCRLAMQAVQEQGLQDQVRIIENDILEEDLSAADVVTIYLLPEVMERIRQHLEQYLHHGMRIVVLDAEMPGWTPTTSTTTEGDNQTYRINLYTISRPGEWVSFSKFGRKH